MVDVERQPRILLPALSGHEPQAVIPRRQAEILRDDANAQLPSTCGPRPVSGLGDQSLTETCTTSRRPYREVPQPPDVRLPTGWANESTAQNSLSGPDSADQGETLGYHCREVFKAPEGRIVRSVVCSDSELGDHRPEGLVLNLQALRVPLSREISDGDQRRCSFQTLSTSWAHIRPKSQP